MVDAFDLRQRDLMLKGDDSKATIKDLSMEKGLGRITWQLQLESNGRLDRSVKPLQVLLSCRGQYQLVI